jgi:hypothetical protein
VATATLVFAEEPATVATATIAQAEEPTTVTAALAAAALTARNHCATVATRAILVPTRNVTTRSRSHHENYAVHRRSPPMPPRKQTAPGRGSVSATTRVPVSRAVIARSFEETEPDDTGEVV